MMYLFFFFMEHPFLCGFIHSPRPLFSHGRIYGIQIFGKNLVIHIEKKTLIIYIDTKTVTALRSHVHTSVTYNLSLLVRIVDIFFRIFSSALLRQRKFYEFRYTLYAIIYFNRENFFIDKVYVLKSIGKMYFYVFEVFLALLYLFE